MQVLLKMMEDLFLSNELMFHLNQEQEYTYAKYRVASREAKLEAMVNHQLRNPLEKLIRAKKWRIVRMLIIVIVIKFIDLVLL